MEKLQRGVEKWYLINISYIYGITAMAIKTYPDGLKMQLKLLVSNEMK